MNKLVIRNLIAASLLLPAMVLAHTGADAGHTHGALSGGLLHPFTGIDHLAAMLAVGLWSALAVRPVWLAPTAFVSLLAAGAVAGFSGLAVPAVEPMIAASLLVIGLLLATRQQLPMALAAVLAGGFAFFHGAAHGTELAGAGQWLALAGMVASTALLHGAGVLLGQAVFARYRWLSASTGGAVALLGSALLVRMV